MRLAGECGPSPQRNTHEQSHRRQKGLQVFECCWKTSSKEEMQLGGWQTKTVEHSPQYVRESELASLVVM